MRACTRVAALLALGVALLALSASTMHLGRPIHAVRALKMWRRSWLSREVLLFTIFAAAATAYSVSSLLANSFATATGAATVLFGIAGVGASARLYLVPGRPAWNSPLTVFEFFATASNSRLRRRKCHYRARVGVHDRHADRRGQRRSWC